MVTLLDHGIQIFGAEITYQIQTKINLCFSFGMLISLTTLGSQFTWIAPTKGPEGYCCVPHKDNVILDTRPTSMVNELHK